MLSPLNNPVFRRLFAAQVVSLFGTGLMTVALALLAWRIAGANAGAVLGTALAIKMIAYVTVSPVASAIAARFANKFVLVVLDLFRAAIAVLLPFVDQVWQIYALVFLLQAASAAFTPVFQSVIPEILADEDEYTKALSLSRLAYDLESLASPIVAAGLLALMSFHWLFAGTAAGFAISALLVVIGPVPNRLSGVERPFRERLTGGMQKFAALPQLRGLMALNLVAAGAGAMVIVNTVVVMRTLYGLGEGGVALAYAVFGAGSMLAALTLPQVLPKSGNRSVMLAGAAAMTISLVSASVAIHAVLPVGIILVVWFVAGVGYSAVLTPVGRLLASLSTSEERPSLFAAQFALSHAGWLTTYPLAGWGGALIGMAGISAVLAVMSLVAAAACLRLWPAEQTGPTGAEDP